MSKQPIPPQWRYRIDRAALELWCSLSAAQDKLTDDDVTLWAQVTNHPGIQETLRVEHEARKGTPL